MWQMLLKALEEVAAAPNAMMAAEMAVIRLTHVADLPSPDELIRKLQNTPAPSVSGAAPRPAPTQSTHAPQSRAPSNPGGTSAIAVAPVSQPVPGLDRYASFPQVMELIRHHRDVQLLVDVEKYLRLAAYAPGRIEFEPTADAPPDFAQRLGQRLQAWTGNRWAVTVVNEGGAPTIAEDRAAEQAALEVEAQAHPMMAAVLEAFPGAKILEIRTPEEISAQAEIEALPEVPDEWDPFEED